MKATKENIDWLIDHLVDKTLSFGLRYLHDGHENILNYINFNDTEFWEEEDKTITPCSDTEDHHWLNECKILGHPIRIGDVIKKMIKGADGSIWKMISLLCQKWMKCGLSKSLQQIIEDSGFEYVECIDPDCPCGKFPLRNNKCKYKSELKDINAHALGEFLLDIFKTNE